MRMQVGQELAVVDADLGRHGLVLAVHVNVEVRVEVDHRALGAELRQPEGPEPVGEVVDAGIPRRRARLDADQFAPVDRRRRAAAAPAPEREEEHGDDSDRGDARGGEGDRCPERAPLFGRALTALVDPPLGGLDFPRRGWSSRFLGQGPGDASSRFRGLLTGAPSGQ